MLKIKLSEVLNVRKTYRQIKIMILCILKIYFEEIKEQNTYFFNIFHAYQLFLMNAEISTTLDTTVVTQISCI